MTIIKIQTNENGGHDNQTMDGETPKTFPIPDGYAIIPESVGTPDTLKNYPFGEITVKTINGIPTVTSWTPLPIPAPEPVQTDTAVTTETMAAAIREGVNEV